MKYFLLPALCLAVTVTATQSAKAALVLNIDLSTEELFLTGTDTGSAESSIFGSGAGWSRLNLSDPQGSEPSSSIDLISSLDPGSTFTSFSFIDTVERDPNTGILGGAVSISSGATSGAVTTLIGNGTRISYAGMDGIFKSSIQGLALAPEDDFTLTGGSSGFSSISITVIPVPEPSSCVLLGTGMLAIFGARRRRC